VRYISDAEVPLFFSAADTCILPYKSATQSGITSIAFHFELPMIATDVGGLKELIKHGDTGEIIDKVSVESISKGIEQFFIGDKALRYKENIQKEKSQMNWGFMAEQIVDLYQSLD
jgi:glycosyltransferase involved in cell wall biosynthesis